MSDLAQRRWRLALGRYANAHLSIEPGRDMEMDQTLDYLYGREYKKRGVKYDKGAGSLDPTQLNALKWLGNARSLFPESVFDVLQEHALDRYGIDDLLKDPKALDALEPNQNLLKVLMAFDGRADPEVKEKLRAIARQVIDEIVARLRQDVERAFSGRRNRFRRSNIASAANFDWRRTVRANLASYDAERGRLLADKIYFNARERRRLTWNVILCVDQSGSMTDSIIHAAVMATILSGLPGVNVKMILFDTSVVDVTDRLTDPLETLLSVQLGGGTDIGKAMTYCESLVENPERTVVALITDFGEGASPRTLYAAVARLIEQQVKLIGLAALDDSNSADYDHMIAGKLADLGMHIGAMTPNRFAQWLVEIMG